MSPSGRKRRRLIALGAVTMVVVALTVMSAAGAITLPGIGSLGNGLNDLSTVPQSVTGTTGVLVGQNPTRLPTAYRAEPPLLATPVAHCGPGSRPEPGVDGRVPAGSGVHGLWCNVAEVAHQGTSGGFKTFRYVDEHGHVCAFYDTALLYPDQRDQRQRTVAGRRRTRHVQPGPSGADRHADPGPDDDPARVAEPQRQRGLLAAVNGNPSTEPGLVSIYDVHADCRHPVLDSTALVARFGHESGFSPDGRIFYATSTATASITAIDVTDPKAPRPIWQGNIYSHGMTLSNDGNRAYIADPNGGDMLILDTSQIQAHKANPQAREISRLGWKTASIPQNAIPFTENGHPYVLEFDEYTAGTLNPQASRDVIGAARIIDIANENAPYVVANLRLQVDQPADHHAAGNDPGTLSPAQGYAAHYCNIPTRVNPKLVACSFIASGLRLFDISQLTHPHELGYFVSPTTPNTETGYTESDYAMSQPTFDVARHDVWYTDGGTGFYVVHVADDVWPQATTPSGEGCPSATGRLSGRTLGKVSIGMTRSRARRAYAGFAQRRASMDYFCVSPNGIRVGYPSTRFQRTLTRGTRNSVNGRAILALTGNQHYALDGVRAGARVSRVRHHLRLGPGIRIGANTWYLTPAGHSRGVVKVRHGVIQEVGIVARSLTGSRKAQRRLLSSFS